MLIYLQIQWADTETADELRPRKPRSHPAIPKVNTADITAPAISI